MQGISEIGENMQEGLLTDRFGRKHEYLRISLTDRCNLRCTYCLPEEKGIFQPQSSLMQAHEVEEIANVFVKNGIRKIRITGGEPLIRKDAPDILRRLGRLPVKLSLSTNAVRIHLFTEILKASGIESVNVSLDSLRAEKFEQMTRRTRFDQVWRNVLLLTEQGFKVKINAVLIRGMNEDEVVDFVGLTRDLPVEVRFIEYMPFPGNGWSRDKVVSMQEILEMAGTRFSFESSETDKHDTALVYRIPGFAGKFGIISTITRPFCGACNRLRLTADGKIKNCLFSRSEMDLLSALRQGEALEPLIYQAVQMKKEQTGGQDFSLPTQNRPMISIGG